MKKTKLIIIKGFRIKIILINSLEIIYMFHLIILYKEKIILLKLLFLIKICQKTFKNQIKIHEKIFYNIILNGKL